MKPFTVIGLLLAAVLLAAALYTSRSDSKQTALRPPDPRNRDGSRTFHPPPRTPDADPNAAPTTRPGVRRPPRSTPFRTIKPTTLGSLPQAQPKPEEPTPDETEPTIPLDVARAALAMVGHDPDAEDAWIEAINDPAHSPQDRSDLIEDLNEQGFPDPKNITFNDLPLILSRLALIEEVGPDAMDEVNEAAFAEAYKDLTNMVTKLEAQAEEIDPDDAPAELQPHLALLAQYKQFQEQREQPK